MKLILRNSNLKFETKKVLVEQSTLNASSMSDTNYPGKIFENNQGFKIYIYKNVSGGNLQFTLTGKGNTWTNAAYLYGIFDEEPVIGSQATSYLQLQSAGQVFDLDIIVPNGNYIGISDYAYAPDSGGSCTVTYEEA